MDSDNETRDVLITLAVVCSLFLMFSMMYG